MHDGTHRDPTPLAANRRQRRDPNKDVETVPWAAKQLRVSVNTAYGLARAGKLPGCHKWGNQWRISVPRFLKAVHGDDEDAGAA